MIRGPVLPLARDGLWQLVQQRSELFERGLVVVAERLELGTGDLGPVDGLLRDAAGGAVLVFTTDDRDLALPARVFAAHGFWTRNRDSLPRALPEAELRRPVRCRLLVVGARLQPGVVDALRRLELDLGAGDALEVVEIEPFGVGGRERLALRNLLAEGGGTDGALAAGFGDVTLDDFGGRGRDFDSGPGRGAGDPRRATSDVAPLVHGVLSATLDGGLDGRCREVFASLALMLSRLDPRIRVDGDRFSRRAGYRGRPLCEYWFADERVLGAIAGGEPCWLDSELDVRTFGDQVARYYLALRRDQDSAGADAGADVTAVPASERGSARGKALEMLRATVSQARLSGAEYTALGGTPDEDPG